MRKPFGMTRYGQLLLLVPVLVIASMFTVARAEQKLLEEVVVTASKSESELSKEPAGITVLYGEDMEISGARVVADYLNLVPGLQLEDVEGNGTKTMMTMRGMPHLNSEYILVLVDSIPQNLATSEVHWASIPMEIVEKIEVVRGPGSALYGMNAMGGVINIITKKLAAEPGGGISASYGSHNENSQSAFFSGTKNRTGFVLSAKRSASDGWRERNCETLNYNVFGKLVHRFSDTTSMSLNLSYAEWDNDWPDFIPLAQYQNGAREEVFFNANESAKKPEASLRLDHRLTKNITLSNRLYGQSVEKNWENIVNVIDEDTEALGIGDEFQVRMTHDIAGRPNTLTAGLLMEHKSVDSVRYFSNLFPNPGKRGMKIRDTESDIRVFAAFFHDTLQVTDKLSLTAGLRCDMVDIEYQNNLAGTGSQSTDYNHVSPKVGVAYSALENLSLFANIGTGFKSPGGSLVAQNPEIKPEKLTSYEAGIKTGLFDRLSFQAVYYTSYFTDQIASVQDPDSPTGYRMTNAGESRMKGIEIEAGCFILDGLMIFGNYTHNLSTYSTFLDEYMGDLGGKTLAFQPENKITAGMRYHHDSGIRAGITARWVDEQYMSAANEYVLDSHAVVDAQLSYEFTNGLSLSIAVRNLFDKDYASYGENWGGTDIYYTPGDPRTVLARVDYKF